MRNQLKVRMAMHNASSSNITQEASFHFDSALVCSRKSAVICFGVTGFASLCTVAPTSAFAPGRYNRVSFQAELHFPVQPTI